MVISIPRALAVAATGVGLALSLISPAQAEGGNYGATLDNKCGSAYGTYHYYATNSYNNKQAYKTDWDMDVADYCGTNGRAVSLYTKYSKWDGQSWIHYTASYHKIGDSGTGTNVADVQMFVCEVGYPSTCKSLW